MALFKRLSVPMRGSMTFDNGGEFARHTLLRSLPACGTYFCDPYASCQKGGVESSNGRLRRWRPKTMKHRPGRARPRRRPGHRPDTQHHAAQRPRVQDANRGLPRRTWQRQHNPCCLSTVLHFNRNTPRTTAHPMGLAAGGRTGAGTAQTAGARNPGRVLRSGRHPPGPNGAAASDCQLAPRNISLAVQVGSFFAEGTNPPQRRRKNQPLWRKVECPDQYPESNGRAALLLCDGV